MERRRGSLQWGPPWAGGGRHQRGRHAGNKAGNTTPRFHRHMLSRHVRSALPAQKVAQRSPLVSALAHKREHAKEIRRRQIALDTVDLAVPRRLLAELVQIEEKLDGRSASHPILAGNLPFTQ